MGFHFVLMSVLQQNPITPNSKHPTHDGAPLQAEVSAATGPLPTKLSTTKLQWGPIAH